MQTHHGSRIAFELHDWEFLSSRLCGASTETASSRMPPVDLSWTSTPNLWSMLPNALVLACRREERVQKAVSFDYHGPGDARLSAVLNPLRGVRCDYVLARRLLTGLPTSQRSPTPRLRALLGGQSPGRPR